MPVIKEEAKKKKKKKKKKMASAAGLFSSPATALILFLFIFFVGTTVEGVLLSQLNITLEVDTSLNESQGMRQ